MRAVGDDVVWRWRFAKLEEMALLLSPEEVTDSHYKYSKKDPLETCKLACSDDPGCSISTV